MPNDGGGGLGEVGIRVVQNVGERSRVPETVEEEEEEEEVSK